MQKGSYPNNTNVKVESDVDIAVHCHEVLYQEGNHPPAIPYLGHWTPASLRWEIEHALLAYFGHQVVSPRKVAFRVSSTSTSVDADVVPCFDYRFYRWDGAT